MAKQIVDKLKDELGQVNLPDSAKKVFSDQYEKLAARHRSEYAKSQVVKSYVRSLLEPLLTSGRDKKTEFLNQLIENELPKLESHANNLVGRLGVVQAHNDYLQNFENGVLKKGVNQEKLSLQETALVEALEHYFVLEPTNLDEDIATAFKSLPKDKQDKFSTAPKKIVELSKFCINPELTKLGKAYLLDPNNKNLEAVGKKLIDLMFEGREIDLSAILRTLPDPHKAYLLQMLANSVILSSQPKIRQEQLTKCVVPADRQKLEGLINPKLKENLDQAKKILALCQPGKNEALANFLKEGKPLNLTPLTEKEKNSVYHAIVNYIIDNLDWDIKPLEKMLKPEDLEKVKAIRREREGVAFAKQMLTIYQNAGVNLSQVRNEWQELLDRIILHDQNVNIPYLLQNENFVHQFVFYDVLLKLSPFHQKKILGQIPKLKLNLDDPPSMGVFINERMNNLLDNSNALITNQFLENYQRNTDKLPKLEKEFSKVLTDSLAQGLRVNIPLLMKQIPKEHHSFIYKAIGGLNPNDQGLILADLRKRLTVTEYQEFLTHL